MKPMFKGLMLAATLLAGGQAVAGDLLQWQNNSLTYLWGKNFTVNPQIQQTVTFEHADAWKYGDNFFFLDRIFYNGKEDGNVGPSTYYGEFSPRLSFGKIFDKDLSFGPIKDVLLAFTYEFGEGDNESYLLGPGFDLNIPGFDYFQLNFYQRQTEGNRRRRCVADHPGVVVHPSRGQLQHPDRRLYGLGGRQRQERPWHLSRQPALQPTSQI